MKYSYRKNGKLNPHIILCLILCSLFLCFMISLDYVNKSYSNPLITKAYSINSNTTTTSQTHIADYTLLVYMIGSDFESKNYSASKDIAEMEKAGSTSNINIVLQTGGGLKSFSPNEIDFSKVQRHQIINGTLHTLLNLGIKNMGGQNTLSEFIKWGVSNFPAKKYAIIFWDHGSGINGFGKDINFFNDGLTPSELLRAFDNARENTGKFFDLIGFDACLMSSLEVASKLHFFSPYLVSSEEIEPAWGWNYTNIIKSLTSKPDQSGDRLGKSIIDSYYNSTKYLSKSENYEAQKEITLSLIDMTKIPQLINNVNWLSNAIKSKITSVEAAVNLSKSIDMTEHYGQSASGSIGLIDLYDFTTNLQEKFPDLLPNIKSVQNAINSSVVYSYRGDARPNSFGISVYMPLFKNEYNNKSELQVVDPYWLYLLLTQRYEIQGDMLPPVIKSIREGDAIVGGVYGSDISNIFAEIITNSSNGSKLKYVQNIDPSFLNSSGFFNYKDHKLLVVCNETKCIPTSSTLEINRGGKFVFLPIRIQSEDNLLNKNASLVYELDSNNNFIFLGINPNTNPGETTPKGEVGLQKNDKIFLKALSANPSVNTGNINSNNLANISTYEEDGPLLVNNSYKIIPKYVYLLSPFAIRFTLCDYSDNCNTTRWYQFDSNKKSEYIPLKGDEFGYGVISKKDIKEQPPNSANIYYTYINPTYGFKISYPSDWLRKSQNISDINNYDDSFEDSNVVSFSPSKYVGVPGSNFYPSFQISITDWPFKETPKIFFDYFKSTTPPTSKIVQAGPTTIAGSNAFVFVIEEHNQGEQLFHLTNETRKDIRVDVLMNGRMYSMSFSSYSSQFNTYLPIIEKMINSFNEYSNQDQTYDNNIERISKNSNNLLIENIDNNLSFDNRFTNNTQNITKNIIWFKYTDPVYGFSIEYPSNLGLGKPIPAKASNSNLSGIFFDLGISASPELKDSVSLFLNSFKIGEKDKTKFSIAHMPFKQNLKYFDRNYMSTVANNIISFYNQLPDSKMLANKITTLNNNTAFNIEFRYFLPQGKTMMYEKLVYITNGQDLTTFQFQANPEKFKQYSPIFQKMINSFDLSG